MNDVHKPLYKSIIDFPTIVSFYTKNTLYESEVQKLIESCERYELDYWVEGIESFGAWELNCAYKPFFIHRMIQRLQRPVLWVDADATFQQKPASLPAFQADLAVRINLELPLEHPSRVMTGTVFAGATDGAERLLRTWAEACQKELTTPGREVEFWDQVALRDVLALSSYYIQNLPKAYVKIEGHPQDELEVPDAVIQHHQASRWHKSLWSQLY